MSLLEIERLSLTIGDTPILRDVELSVAPGEVMGLVGESGSGKTITALTVMRLLPWAARASGRVAFDGIDILAASEDQMCALRGDDIGMVFQEPMVSLNPAVTIGEQMAEGLRLHSAMSRAEIKDRSLAMLERIQIKDPGKCLAAYPHEFSGGMRQRIMLASVMLLKPRLLIADEPTTALDTLVQRDVLDLMVELTRENGTAVLLISHDLGMVSHYVKNVTVMCEGKAVEQGSSTQVLHAPQHDYTKRLVDALPKRSAGGSRKTVDGPPLVEISNVVIDYPGRPRLFGRAQPKRAVDGVDLTIRRGETLALVGASGSGK
ncbi:MAG: ABC transporter ATP-binding protein, partial [Mesorhizobium sp.]